MTDQEAQKEFDEAMKVMEEVANSNNPLIALSRTVRVVPNLINLVHYLMQEVKRLKTPQLSPLNQKQEKICIRCGGTQFQAAPAYTGLCAECWQKQYGSLDRQMEIERS